MAFPVMNCLYACLFEALLRFQFYLRPFSLVTPAGLGGAGFGGGCRFNPACC